MIKEIQVKNAFDKEVTPDGQSLLTLDGYQGCQLQCPYCFQMDQKEWGKAILVRTNIVEVLEEAFEKQPDIKEIFLGSQSDPYMPLEETYELTRSLLLYLKDKACKVYLTTKAGNALILRDKEILKTFKKHITIIMGLAGIDHAHKGAKHPNIAVANELKRAGIPVEVHITPILPYVMDLDGMIQAIDQDITIYLDQLRIFTGASQDQKIFQWIKKAYPQYIKQYEKIIFEGDKSYYKEIVERYKNDQRIHFLFK